ERFECKFRHHQVLTHIASFPTGKHFVQAAEFLRNIGKHVCVALKKNMESLFQDHIGHCTVLSNVCRLTHKCLVDPLRQTIHYSLTPVCCKGTGGTKHRTQYTLCRSYKLKTEYKTHIQHTWNNGFFIIQDSYVSCHRTTLLIGNKR